MIDVPGFKSLRLDPWPDAVETGARSCVIAFDAALFSPSAFTDTGMVCPPSIARSVRKRQAEFFFGRWAARNAMAALGRMPVDLPIGPSRAPLWPDDLVGCISHHADIAMATVTDRGGLRGVGIDVERVVDDAQFEALVATSVDAAELDRLRACAQPAGLSLHALVTLVFSAKESLFKAAFASVGRFFDFSAARLSALDTGMQQLELTIQEDLCPALPRGEPCRVKFRFLDAGTVFTSFAW